MAYKITEFKTKSLIMRERFPGCWTVEQKDGNNVIGQIESTGPHGFAPWEYKPYIWSFTSEMLSEISKAVKHLETTFPSPLKSRK
jgi:hypothetical protein